MDMRSEFLSTPYGQVHARIAGSGPAVLFLHGRDPAVNGWRAWEANLPAVAAAACRAVALDLPGYGEVARPEGPISDASAVDCVMEVMDRLGLLQVVLVGNSWGGMLAWKAALLAPRRVERLVLVAAAGARQAHDKFPGEIACPTLVVWAEEDPVIPAANAQLFADAIPHVSVRLLSVAAEEAKGLTVHPLAGHQPQRLGHVFNEVLIEFLKGR